MPPKISTVKDKAENTALDMIYARAEQYSIKDYKVKSIERVKRTTSFYDVTVILNMNDQKKDVTCRVQVAPSRTPRGISCTGL